MQNTVKEYVRYLPPSSSAPVITSISSLLLDTAIDDASTICNARQQKNSHEASSSDILHVVAKDHVEELSTIDVCLTRFSQLVDDTLLSALRSLSSVSARSALIASFLNSRGVPCPKIRRKRKQQVSPDPAVPIIPSGSEEALCLLKEVLLAEWRWEIKKRLSLFESVVTVSQDAALESTEDVPLSTARFNPSRGFLPPVTCKSPLKKLHKCRVKKQVCSDDKLLISHGTNDEVEALENGSALGVSDNDDENDDEDAESKTTDDEVLSVNESADGIVVDHRVTSRRCRQCNFVCPKTTRSFCSNACLHLYKIRSSGSFARKCLFIRDKGVCAICHLDTDCLRLWVNRELRRVPSCQREQVLSKQILPQLPWEVRRNRRGLIGAGQFWHGDHILPVCQGGGEANLIGYRTLCVPCHKQVTASQRRQMAQARKENKTSTTTPPLSANLLKLGRKEAETQEVECLSAGTNDVEIQMKKVSNDKEMKDKPARPLLVLKQLSQVCIVTDVRHLDVDRLATAIGLMASKHDCISVKRKQQDVVSCKVDVAFDDISAVKQQSNITSSSSRPFKRHSQSTKQHESSPQHVPEGEKRKRSKKNKEEEEVNFTLSDIRNALCVTPPDYLDVRDDQLSLSLLEGVGRAILDDMVGWFVNDGSIADEARSAGPVKWKYSNKNPFDFFDYYAAMGCPNCGQAYELDFPYAFHKNPPTLICLHCGHRACPLHQLGESDSLMDRYEPTNKPPELEPLSVFTAHQSSLSTRGCRERYNLGVKGKLWWQDRYLHRAIRLQSLNRTITTIATMSKLKAPTVKEICEVCGHDEAFYSTYQARSADEGMTIMYECTRCHHRKTFNN